MKKIILFTLLSLLVPFSSYAKYPYGKGTKITFKDRNGCAKKMDIRDEIVPLNFDYTSEDCSVPSMLLVGAFDYREKLDREDAERICKSMPIKSGADLITWRLPTQKELETISSLESTITEKSKRKRRWDLLKSTGKYKYLKRDKYWVSTVKSGEPLYLDLSGKESSVGVISQDSVLNVRCVRDWIEKFPTFNGGGLDEFERWIMENIKYPEFALERKMNGAVYFSFVVDTQGRVVDFKESDKHGFQHPAFVEEVVRVLKFAPLWTPGVQNGRVVRVKFSAPIHFQMRPKNFNK